MSGIRAFFLLALTLVFGCESALAEDGDTVLLSGTLKTIKDRGTILIGYRDTAPPFSFLNKAGQPIGFSLDLCHGIAEDVAHLLSRDLLEADAPAWQQGLRIVYVPVTADARLPKVMSGAVDLECGSTTANAERSKSVAFSPVFFLAGTKILAPRAPAADKPVVASYRDLAGRAVVVGKGTTNAPVLQRLAKGLNPPMTVTEVSSLDDAYKMLSEGGADAFASDDILLSGYVATRPDGHRFAVVGDYLSFEPYAITLRRDDQPFADLVRASFQRMAEGNILATRYRRWFIDKIPTGETLDLPMSSQLSEMYRALGQPD